MQSTIEGTGAYSGVKSKTEMEFFISCVTEEEIKRERAKARELRKSQRWKRKCSEGRCYYCNKNFSPKELTMDHVVPIIRGGKSTKGNMVPACKECNSKKKHMLPMEWDEYIEKIKSEKA